MFTKNVSEWAVYDGRKNANVVPITSSKNDTALSGAEKETLKNARDWAEEFFKSRSSNF